VGYSRQRVRRVVKIVASRDRIELVIEGLREQDGNILLNTFMAQLQNLSAVLAKIDRENNEGKNSSHFDVVSLSHNSPYRVGIEAVANKGNPDAARLVLERLDYVAGSIRSGNGLDDIDTDLLESLHALAKPVGKSIKNSTIFYNGSVLELTAEVGIRLESALATEDECDGSIAGMLEQINLHHDANVFHIYPNVGPKKIMCHFPPSLYDEAVSAVGRKIDVFGQMKYRSGASFPHKIAVKNIETFDRSEDLPDWDDLRGRAPNATGALSSEAFVRELRDAW
jgi:hypothetical protein